VKGNTANEYGKNRYAGRSTNYDPSKNKQRIKNKKKQPKASEVKAAKQKIKDAFKGKQKAPRMGGELNFGKKVTDPARQIPATRPDGKKGTKTLNTESKRLKPADWTPKQKQNQADYEQATADTADSQAIVDADSARQSADENTAESNARRQAAFVGGRGEAHAAAAAKSSAQYQQSQKDNTKGQLAGGLSFGDPNQNKLKAQNKRDTQAAQTSNDPTMDFFLGPTNSNSNPEPKKDMGLWAELHATAQRPRLVRRRTSVKQKQRAARTRTTRTHL